MNVILIPGLEHAGHRTHPITLPGMESQDLADLDDKARAEFRERAILCSTAARPAGSRFRVSPP